MNIEIKDIHGVLINNDIKIIYVQDYFESSYHRITLSNGKIYDYHKLGIYCEEILEDIANIIYLHDYKLVYLDDILYQCVLEIPKDYEQGYNAMKYIVHKALNNESEK